MYASIKESFVFSIAILLELVLEVDNEIIRGFIGRHLGRYGSILKTAGDPVDNEWGHAVVDDALSMIEKIENV
jgi:hypothetical protein